MLGINPFSRHGQLTLNLQHAIVVRVDSEKGYIDLSKRRVTPEDVIKCEERYNKAKSVSSIVWSIAKRSGRSMMDIHSMVTWPLAREHKTAYDALTKAMADPESVLSTLDLDPQIKALLASEIKKRLTPQPVKIRADIEVSCYTVEGIDAVRAALTAGLELGTKEFPIKINLVAPPLYVMSTSSLDKKAGIEALDKAVAAIEASIKQKGGNMKIKNAPRATTSKEEDALDKELRKLAEENLEVDGDDEEDDDGGYSRPQGGSGKVVEEEEEEEGAQ